MLRKRKHLTLITTLALVLLLLSNLTPRPVLAAEINVSTEQALRNAIDTAGYLDVINVVGNITLGSTLSVKQGMYFTITSKNNSSITYTSQQPLLALSGKVEVTLAGNIKLNYDGLGMIGSSAVSVNHSTFILTEDAVINAKEGSGIFVTNKGTVRMVDGGTINATSDRGASIAGVYANDSSICSVYKGTINIQSFGYSKGIVVSGAKSVASFLDGMIKVEGNASFGIDAEANAHIAMSGGYMLVNAHDQEGDPYEHIAIGLSLGNSATLSMVGGGIWATCKGNTSWGIKAWRNCRLNIGGDNAPTIYGETSSITLVGTGNLLDVYSFPHTRIWNAGGIQEEDANEKLTSIIRRLPGAVNLLTGRGGGLQLAGVEAPIRFLVDSVTSPKLSAYSIAGRNVYILYSDDEVQCFLALTGTTSVQENTVILRIPVTVRKIPFSDITITDWACDYIMNLNSKDIIKGYPNGTFRPGNKLWREHAAKMITLSAELPYKGKKADFPDVDPDGEMSPYIAALVEKGAIRGYPDGTFRPSRNITRAEISQIVAKAFDLEMGNLPASFPDLPSGEAGNYIKILASNGIVKGYSDGKFKPRNLVSREECCKILTVAMAVSGVQKAEKYNGNPYLPRELLWIYIDPAQELIDALPDNQDLQTKQYLQARLDLIK